MRFSDLGLKNKLFKLSVWKVLEPLFNVQCVFEFDLAQVHQLSSTKVGSTLGSVLKTFHGTDEVDDVCTHLTHAGTSPLVVRRRLERGDMVAMVLFNGQVAAYTWVTFSSVWVREIRRNLMLSEGNAVQFDTLVIPRWRGKGLQYAVTLPILQRLADQGFRRTLAWVNVFNRHSIKNQLRQGKRKIATWVSVPFLGIVWVFEGSTDTSLKLERESGHFT